MTADDELLLRTAYDAFNARDIEAAVALMAPDVDWPNAIEGGRLLGRDAVRAYWGGQFQATDPRVDPTGISDTDDGRIAVAVHQVVRSLDGTVLVDGHVTHVYTIRDGLVARMDIE
jgi:hypothetical protein